MHNAIRYGVDLLRGFPPMVGLDESEEGVSRLGETLTPIFDAWSKPEHARLRGEALLVAYVDGLAAGGAGNRTQMAVDNPVGSRVLTIVERILIASAGAAETLLLSFSQTQLPTVTNAMVGRDTRPPITAANAFIGSRTRLRTSIAIPLAGNIADVARLRVNSAAQDTREYQFDFVIAPGWSLRLRAAADNLGILAETAFFCREVHAFPGDRLD